MSATNVGVLELTIESNASSAATSLGGLADALTRVKEAVGTNSFGLGEIGKQLNAFAKQVAQAKSTVSVLKTISEFGNAMSKLSKIGQFSVDTESFEKLKTAVSGFSIGNIGSQMNQLRLAMSGTWGDGKSAQSMSDLHDRIQAFANDTPVLLDFARAMKDASSSLTEMNKSVAASGDWRMSMMGASSSESVSTGANVAAGLETGMKSGRESLIAVATELADAMIEVFRSRLEINSPSKVTTRFGEYTGEGLAVGLQNSMPEVVRVAEDISNRMVSAVSSGTIADPVAQIADSFRNAAVNVRYYSSALDTVLPKVQELGSAEMIEAGNARYAAMSERERLLAIAEATGKIPPIDTDKSRDMEVVLEQSAEEVKNLNISLTETGDIVSSILIPQFKEMYQIWSMMAYEFGMFANSATRLMSGDSVFALGDGRTPGQLLLGDGTEPQTFLSTWVQTGEQWKQNWVDWSSEAAQEMRASWSPNWIIGEGTVTASVDGMEDVTSATDDIRNAANATNVLAEEVSNLGETASSQSQTFNEAIEFARQWNNAIPQNNLASESHMADVSWIDNLLESASKIDLLNMKIEDMTAKLYEGATSGKMTGEQIASLALQIQKAREEVDELISSCTGVSGALGALGRGLKKMFPTLTNLISRFKSMAKMRAMRYVIRAISSGFSEGVQNVYQYSRVVGTNLAPSMDNAKSSLEQFKNSIGAAVSPLITALVPALQTVINWLITGINYINQFFALLNGQSTWTRALYNQSEAYKDTTKNAKGASSAMKDLLADWDELNIIQSNSSGGGAATTADTTKDYANMFEEVNQFDEKVKEVFSFIEDHLGGIVGLATKLGTIFLGWRMSKAFSGILGQLGKLIAGGAMMVLGVELAFGGGFEAGKKGYFDTGDLIASIGGTIATAIGGSLITSALGFGSGVGFAIGITVGVIATLVGWIEGQADLFDTLKWGSQTLTPEQVNAYVKSMFTFDIDAEITVLDANIANRQQAAETLTTEIDNFTGKLQLAKIKVGMQADDSVTAINEAYESAKTALSSVQTFIDTNEDALSVTMGISPPKDGQGNDITEDVLSQVMVADKTLKQYFIDLGKELADAMYQGEKDGWTEGEMEAVLSLMEHQRNIIAGAEARQRDLTFEMDYKFTLNTLTRDNAKDIFNQEKERIEEYKQQFMRDRETAKEAAIKELAYAEEAIADYRAKGLDTTELEAAAQTYRNLIEGYLDPEQAEKDWELKLNESMSNMRAAWAEALKRNGYGMSEAETYQRSTLMQQLGAYKTPGTDLADDLYNASKNGNPVQAATKALETYFGVIKAEQPDYIQDMMDTFNLNVWDIASDTIKENLVNVLRQSIGDDYAREVLAGMNISQDEVERYLANGTKVNWEDIVKKNIDEGMTGGGFFGLSYTAPLNIEPEVVNTEDVKEKVKEQIEAAIYDGVIYDYEMKNIVDLYGQDLYNEMLKEMNITTDSEGYLTGKTPWRTTGAAGMSDSWNKGGMSYINRDTTTATQEAETIDYNQMEGSVRNGATSANAGVIDELQTIAQRLSSLLAKEWKVVVSPSSDWGQHNSRSNDAWSKVNG